MEGQFCSNCGATAGQPAPQGVQAPAPPPAAPIAPRKSSLLIWVLVGCGGLIAITLVIMALLGFFVSRKASEFGKNPGFAAAKMMASLNPNVEVVDSDENTGKITLRDKKTGKTVTLDFQDIQKGRISFSGEDGEKVDIQGEGEGGTGSMSIKSSEGTMQIGQGSLDKVPNWVPKYPGGQVTGTYTMQREGADSGTFQIKCSGSVEQVAAFYERELTSAGMKIQKHSMQSGGESMMSVVGSDESSNRMVNATVTSSRQGTVAHIVYGAK